MGGKSETTQNQQQQSISEPWKPAQGVLGGILNQLGGALGQTGLSSLENTALGGILGNSNFLSQFAPGVSSLASAYAGGGPDRSGMVTDAFKNYQSQLAPTISGQFLNPNSNPFFSQVTNSIADLTRDRVNAQYAGAGRDPAGAGSFGGTLGKSITDALAPTFANVYNTERQRQLDATGGLFGGGLQAGGLLSNLDAARLSNAQTGVGLAGTAQNLMNDPYNTMLQVEAMRRGIPLGNLQQIAGLGIPIAGLGGQTNSTGTATTIKDPSLMEDLYMGTAALKNLYPSK